MIRLNELCDRTLLDAKKMDDGITCMAFTVSFVPNTGNKYFLAACDEHVRLYDFETCQVCENVAIIILRTCHLTSSVTDDANI